LKHGLENAYYSLHNNLKVRNLGIRPAIFLKKVFHRILAQVTKQASTPGIRAKGFRLL